MRLSSCLAAALVFTAMPFAESKAGQATDQAGPIAKEAVDTALALPPGYKRDLVLRAVSRNLSSFGWPDMGLRAARAMTDGGISEVPLGTMPGPPRYIPLREALPISSPCDVGRWRQEDGREAKSPKAREKWARECLVARDFHWIGLPSRDQVRAVAAGLPVGDVKGEVLAMLIRVYGDVDTLRFVQGEIAEAGPRLPNGVRNDLQKMLAEPAVLYRLGRRDEALASARKAVNFHDRSAIIRLLVAAGEADAAIAIFELLSDTPPEFSEDCFAWFGPLGGLNLSALGDWPTPVPGIGAFLDRLPASSLFRRVCPDGLDAETAVRYNVAAGRSDAAVVRARLEKANPFLLIDTLLQVGRDKLRIGDRNTARALAEEAAAALPPFDAADPVEPGPANSTVIDMSMSADDVPKRNYGESPGHTQNRFETIRLLAAAGAVTQADMLARKQPAGALRAVALSAAVAGRAGIRFDDQAPSLDGISASDL